MPEQTELFSALAYIDVMTIHKTTEQKQLWKHVSSGQVLFLDAIAPLDATDVNAEYRYSSQGMDMGSEADFATKGWVKIDECGHVGTPQAGESDIFSLVEELVAARSH